MSYPMHERKLLEAIKSGELEVDSEGRVWRLAKRTANRWSGGTRTTACARVRAEAINSSGYLQVRMMRDSKRVAAAAHRLVYTVLVGEIPEGMTINHKDGNKQNNRPDNLELATPSDQRRHALEVLNVNRNRPQGSRHPKTQLTEKDVMAIRKRRDAGEMVKTIAADYSMEPKAISAIVNRRTWKHI